MCLETDLFQEEDFVTQLYNRSLLTEFGVDGFQKLIDQAILWVDEQGGNIDDDLRDAIKSRLVLRRELLAALEQDLRVIDTRSTDNFKNCLAQLSPLAKSVTLGKPVSDAFSLKIQRRLASTIPPRPMVNINVEDALAHLKRLCQDAIDLEQILDYRGPHNFRVAIWTLLSRKPQPSVYIRSLVQSVIAKDTTVLGTIPVKNFLYDDLAELVLPSSILLRANIDEVEVPSDPRFQIATHMDRFARHFAQPFVDTFRSACLNRCRVRRTICHTAVDWDNLQIEAEELDAQLRSLNPEPPLTSQGGQPAYSYPLSSWAYHQKLIQLRMILQLGFELCIYSPEELSGMYWYLTHICSTHLGHIERIRTFTIAASRRNLVSASLGGNKSNTSEEQHAFQRTLNLLERLSTHLIAIDAFAIALHALYALLRRHNLLPTASSEKAYSSEALRYELRMNPFIPITLPELVPFEDYRREAILEGDSDTVVLERATRAISEARKAWEAILANGPFLPPVDSGPQDQGRRAIAIEEDWKKDVKDTMRACIGASIGIETLRKSLKNVKKGDGRISNLRVDIPDIGSKMRWHDWWAVPQITELKVESKS